MQTKISPVRAARTTRDNPMRLVDAAAALGCSVGHLSDAERGLVGLGDKLIAGMARLYGLTVEEMRVRAVDTFNAGARERRNRKRAAA